MVLSCSLWAEDPGKTPREVWESVELKKVRFQEADLSEVVAYLNDAVKKELGQDDFPHAHLDMPQKGGLKIIRHDHEQKERNELADLKIQNLLEGKLKENLEALSSPGQEDLRTVTLELRNVRAFDALRNVVDISGLSLVYRETDYEWLITGNPIHVDLVPVPEVLHEVVIEFIEDGQDVNLMDFFTRHNHWWHGYLGVLNREKLILIVPESEYAQTVKGLGNLPKQEDNNTGWHNGRILLPWKKQLRSPESNEEFLRQLNDLEWGELWQAYIKLKMERAQETPKPDPADPFGFELQEPRPVLVVSIVKNGMLTLEQIDAGRFEVSYSRQKRPGKYFSDIESVISKSVELNNQEISDLFRLHLEGRRDVLWERLKGLGGEVEVNKALLLE